MRRLIRRLTKPIRFLFHLAVAFKELALLIGVAVVLISIAVGVTYGNWYAFAIVCATLAAFLYADLEVNRDLETD